MLENVCDVIRYYKLEKQGKKKKRKIREKKKHVKRVIKSDQLIHFCLTISSVFCTNELDRHCQH